MLSKLETLIQAPTVRLRNWMRRWDAQIARALATGQGLTATPEGLVLFEDKRLRGEYDHWVTGQENDRRVDHNLVPDAAILKALGILFFTDTKISAWYLTLISSATAPANDDTMANFSARHAEITSTTEGFSNVTRPAFTTVAPASNSVNNNASPAAFVIVTASSLNVTGAAVCSDNTRGGSSGILWSDALFSPARVLYNAETFNLKYSTSLSD